MHETAARPALSLWPPDDTEKSVLGTNLHQTAITAVRTGANEAASQEEKPWQAGSQTRVSGFVRPTGRPYATLPDVFVYREPFDLRRATLSLAEDGPPTLIVEVLSDDTWKADLDTERGKGFSYRRGGVAEYLALDPLGEFTGRAGGGLRRPRAADARRGAGAPRGRRGPSRGACGRALRCCSACWPRASVHCRRGSRCDWRRGPRPRLWRR